MTIGWQELVTIVVVGLSALIMVRRAMLKGPGDGACSNCGDTSADSDRDVKITEVHQVTIDRQLPGPTEEP